MWVGEAPSGRAKFVCRKEWVTSLGLMHLLSFCRGGLPVLDRSCSINPGASLWTHGVARNKPLRFAGLCYSMAQPLLTDSDFIHFISWRCVLLTCSSRACWPSVPLPPVMNVCFLDHMSPSFMADFILAALPLVASYHEEGCMGGKFFETSCI